MLLPNPHYHTSDSAVRKRYMAHVEAIRRKRNEPKAAPEVQEVKVPKPPRPPKPPKVAGIKHVPKPVVAIAEDGTSQPYPSLNTAGRLTGIDVSSIRRAFAGKRQTRAGGMRWIYAQNDAA